jgi:hypothetical protein
MNRGFLSWSYSLTPSIGDNVTMVYVISCTALFCLAAYKLELCRVYRFAAKKSRANIGFSSGSAFHNREATSLFISVRLSDYVDGGVPGTTDHRCSLINARKRSDQYQLLI